MKKTRQGEILSIIADNAVETQEELAEMLKLSGFLATQATVSRDIRELGLTKVLSENGRQIYAYLPQKTWANAERARKLLQELVVSADCAGNLLVIKTSTGMGMAAAVNIDLLQNKDIIGTIAGDDVVFCAVRTPEIAEKLKSEYNKLI